MEYMQVNRANGRAADELTTIEFHYCSPCGRRGLGVLFLHMRFGQKPH